MPNHACVLVLLLALALTLAAPTEARQSRTQHITLHHDGGNAPTCKTVKIRRGEVMFELWTSQPSTAPELIVLQNDLGEGPTFVERATIQVLRFERRGKHSVCITSQAELGDIGIAVTRMPKRKGDPEEVEVVVDPTP